MYILCKILNAQTRVTKLFNIFGSNFLGQCHALSILKADIFVGRSKTEVFKLIRQILSTNIPPYIGNVIDF